MILSASRRTDLPAFFGDWVTQILREGVVDVRNPVNPRQISRLEFNADSVECVVFWTKNAGPFLPFLDDIDALGYKYYFQYTVTPYGGNIEKNLDKARAAESFVRLAERIGKEKVIWRYDPVLISDEFSVERQGEAFARLAERLAPFTEKCVLSFIDGYPFLRKAFAENGIRSPAREEMEALAGFFSAAARAHPDLQLASCCEEIDLEKYGIVHNACIDAALAARITGKNLSAKKDKGQRKHCLCAASRDIGAYGTCGHGCVYCYGMREKV